MGTEGTLEIGSFGTEVGSVNGSYGWRIDVKEGVPGVEAAGFGVNVGPDGVAVSLIGDLGNAMGDISVTGRTGGWAVSFSFGEGAVAGNGFANVTQFVGGRHTWGFGNLADKTGTTAEAYVSGGLAIFGGTAQVKISGLSADYGGYEFGGEFTIRTAATSAGDGADDQMLRALYRAHERSTNPVDIPGLRVDAARAAMRMEVSDFDAAEQGLGDWHEGQTLYPDRILRLAAGYEGTDKTSQAARQIGVDAYVEHQEALVRAAALARARADAAANGHHPDGGGGNAESSFGQPNGGNGGTGTGTGGSSGTTSTTVNNYVANPGASSVVIGGGTKFVGAYTSYTGGTATDHTATEDRRPIILDLNGIEIAGIDRSTTFVDSSGDGYPMQIACRPVHHARDAPWRRPSCARYSGSHQDGAAGSHLISSRNGGKVSLTSPQYRAANLTGPRGS
jgi:hypothetical protein